MTYIEQKIKIMINKNNLHKVKEALKTINEVGALVDYDSHNTKKDIIEILDRLENEKFVLNKENLSSKVFNSIKKFYEENKNSSDPIISKLIKVFEKDYASPCNWLEIADSVIDSLKYNYDSVEELILHLKMRDIFGGEPYLLYDLIINTFPNTDFSDFLIKFD